jgi:hypothetical protein
MLDKPVGEVTVTLKVAFAGPVHGLGWVLEIVNVW